MQQNVILQNDVMLQYNGSHFSVVLVITFMISYKELVIMESRVEKQYIRYIADRRLLQLGLKPNFGVKDNPLDWLDDVLGVEHQNFFEGRATTYMKGGIKGNLDTVQFKSLGVED